MHQTILSNHDPIVRKISTPFNLDDATNIKSSIDRLKSVFDDVFKNHVFASSAGLSLVQIGILKKGCIVWLPGEKPIIMINPQIVGKSKETDCKYEGCLCFFDKRGLVPRHSFIKVRYYDENLSEVCRTFSGWGARIVQHEVDHMDGKLYPDAMKKDHILIDLETYARIKPSTQVQNHAKDVMAELVGFIRPGVTERQITEKATSLFEQRGIVEFWYYSIAALVLVGRRTPLSVSGKDYQPTDEVVKDTDMVTIDLSPKVDNIWGDFARTIYIENGETSFDPSSKEYKAGAALEKKLHEMLLQIARLDMTAHDLWQKMNAMIIEHGFENLDFKKNLGHSIEKDMGARCYIEEGNDRKLEDFGLFTFEPHIRMAKGVNGFKNENIYFFAGDKLQPL